MNAKGQPNTIEIYRSGSALWVVIDGTTLPLGWVTRAYTAVDDDDTPYVDLSIKADRIIIDNSMYVIDRGELPGESDDAEVDEERSEPEPQKS